MTLPRNASMPASVVIPTLPYADVSAAADWLERTFGLRVRLRIGGHRIQMMTPEHGDIVLVQAGAPEMRSSLMVRVADVDAMHARVTAAGGQVSGGPETFPYGERQFTAIDCGGHAWTFSQSMADVAPESWGGVAGPAVDG
jgi:uncharacterized glyoxalase superfamily protein PhnB